MKTLKTLLIVGALVFATSAANAQTSFELSKHEMGTHHLEGKFLDEQETLSTANLKKNQNVDQNNSRFVQRPEEKGSIHGIDSNEEFVNGLTAFIITMLF